MGVNKAQFRQLSNLCAQAMDEAIRAVRPGMSEHTIAGLLASAALWPRSPTDCQPGCHRRTDFQISPPAADQ